MVSGQSLQDMEISQTGSLMRGKGQLRGQHEYLSHGVDLLLTVSIKSQRGGGGFFPSEFLGLLPAHCNHAG